ncbi:hypothetical protein C8R44DRAFT_978809 [Mycena epipterygia]|nr:hypothetical protein C8R44DRAFT_978809 [Mycena epipterygia]
MGRSSKVVVSAQTVVELAKYTLIPIRCEAPVKAVDGSVKPCMQDLNCWHLYHKHQVVKHSSKRKMHGGGITYVCGLNKCSAKLHNSSEALKTHVKLSHMKGNTLPCPFANCEPHIPEFGRRDEFNMFLRERDLVAHLRRCHEDLIGCEIDLHSELLLPTWEPRLPIRPLPAPPDLPTHTIPTATFRLEHLLPRRIYSPAWFIHLESDRNLEAVSARHSLALPPTPTPTPMPTPTPVPRTPATGRRRLLRSPVTAASSSPPAHAFETEYDFDDLPEVRYNSGTGILSPAGILAPPHFVVTRTDAAPHAELVRALPMREVPLRPRPPPPTSIFHNALRQQVFAQYALGESAATDAPEPPLLLLGAP